MRSDPAGTLLDMWTHHTHTLAPKTLLIFSSFVLLSVVAEVKHPITNDEA